VSLPPQNRIGLASVICGVVGLVLSFTHWLGLGLGVLGVVLGAVGLSRVKHGLATNKHTAEFGLLLGAMAVVCWVAILVAARLLPEALT